MKKIDLAYMAGIFDGEGCIVIKKSHYKSAKIGERIYHFVQVTIGNNIEWLCRLFQLNFHGNVYHKKSGLWVWQVSSKNAIPFLKAMFPYLKLKRAQAEIAIAFEEKVLSNKEGFFLIEKDFAVREAEKIRISTLNKQYTTIGKKVTNADFDHLSSNNIRVAYDPVTKTFSKVLLNEGVISEKKTNTNSD